MADHDALKGAFQCAGIQLAVQLQAKRNVVGAVGVFHLCQKPQSLLGKGQRHRPFMADDLDGRQLTAPGAAQAARNGCQCAVGKQIAQCKLQ